MRHRVIATPLGAMTLAGDEDGRLAGAWFDGQKYHPTAEALGQADPEAFHDAASQLAEYFEGTRDTFELGLAPRGTDFQVAVWDELRRIPTGETTTYGAIAAALGLRPGAARAVGSAVGHNPISVIVPCHRVVGSAGALTGYAGGLERKQWLLAHEARRSLGLRRSEDELF